MFRNILKSNSNQHPFVYLRGVKYKDLVSLVNFMYEGEVNIEEDDLERFLSTAEDLKIQGLSEYIKLLIKNLTKMTFNIFESEAINQYLTKKEMVNVEENFNESCEIMKPKNINEDHSKLSTNIQIVLSLRWHSHRQS